MFDRVRNPLEKMTANPHHETDEFDASEIRDKKLEKKFKRRANLPLKIGAMALALASVQTAYWSDVQANRAEQAAAEVSINIVSESLDAANSDKATIFIDGFNTYDADYLAETVGPAVQQVADGELWSLSYNNAILSRAKIYQTVLDMAEQRGIESVTVAGYSMGGIVAIELASDIVAESTTEVNSVVMMHTPDGSDGLRTNQKRELGFAQSLADWFPGAADSTWVRFAGELYFYKNNFLRGEFKDGDVAYNADVVLGNVERFGRTFSSIFDKMNDPKRTSMQLLSEQVFKINQFDMLDELKRISQQRDEKQVPALLYVAMDDDNDAMVKNQLTTDNFKTYSAETNMDYFSYLVPDATHSQYNKSIEEYTRVFDQASGPVSQDIDAETARHSQYLAAQEEISIQAVK